MAKGPGRPRKPTGKLSNWGKWKRAQRDHGGKKCSRCGKRGSTDVHHINKNKSDNRPANRMNLCRSCHNKAEPRKG